MKRNILIVCVAMTIGLCTAGCGTKSYLESVQPEEEAAQREDSEDATEQGAQCWVQISGAVKTPGVYQLPQGSRVYEAIEKAGGLREDACADELNQARVLTDGERIHVNTQTEETSEKQEQTEDGRININTASVPELTTLTGIGETRAQAIVDYRESNGLFSVPEDIKKVSGIGESTYENIANAIKTD